MAIGFVVKLVISETMIKEDGTYDDHWSPHGIDEHFCTTFNEALEKYNDHLKTYKDHSWYPAYIHSGEQNKIFFKIYHEGKYNSTAYKTELQIEQCFYKKKN